MDFITNHFDPSLESPTKTKSVMALSLLTNAVKVVDSGKVGELLSKNMAEILIEGLRVKEDLDIPSAANAIESMKSVLIKDDITSEAQMSILKRLLVAPEHVAFDKSTSR